MLVPVVFVMFLSVLIVVADTYKKAGGEVVLIPDSVSDPITSITWKHGRDIAVEWYGDETVEYRDFKGRCNLDTSTGVLIISNLTLQDSGSYTPEINNRVMSPTKITVISAVPKPTISQSCNPEVTLCTLTCEASITDDVRPITYSWEIGDVKKESPTNRLDITKDDTESDGKPISCQLENPVSSERSNDIVSPFTNVHGMDGVTLSLLIVLPIVLIVGALSAFFLIWRKYRRANAKAGTPERLQQETQAEIITEERKPLVNTQNNGTVTLSELNETHNQDQNPASPDDGNEAEEGSKAQEEPSLDQNPGSTHTSSEGEDQTSAGSKDTSNKPETASAQDPTPAVPPATIGEAETSKTTSEVQDESSQDQTPEASTDTSNKLENPAVEDQERSDSDKE